MFSRVLHTVRGELWFWRGNSNIDHLSIESIKDVVATNPYWRRGRVILASKALMQKDFQLAYGEYHALGKLARNDKEKNEAEFLGARILVRTGDFEKALAKLETISNHIPPILVVEEQVAALVALEQHEEALVRINNLPEQHQTAELKALKSFMLRRGDGTLYR